MDDIQRERAVDLLIAKAQQRFAEQVAAEGPDDRIEAGLDDVYRRAGIPRPRRADPGTDPAE